MKTSAKRYHWNTGQKTRAAKAKRWTNRFVIEERNDRNDRRLYPTMPSPLGRHWLHYTHHRLKMMKKGMDVYATPKYTRLRFEKYIRTVRASDEKAGELVNYKPSIIFFGAAETPPNSPIRIKKHMRCPGSRKLYASFKKRGNCVIVFVNECFTSQTCAKCIGRFDPRTKSHRFKVCQNCRPRFEAMLPSMVVTKKGRRRSRLDRLQIFLLEREAIENSTEPDQQKADSLLSKVLIHTYEWLINPVNGEMENVVAEKSNELYQESEW